MTQDHYYKDFYMNSKRFYIILSLGLILLSACAPKQNTPQTITREDYIKKIEYGVWDLDNCTLEAKQADILIKLTDVYSKENRARIYLRSDFDLSEKPEFKIYGFDDYDIVLNGANREFTFELPIELIDQARMHLNQGFIQVTYKIQGKDYYKKAFFSLEKIPVAILELKKTCK